MYGRLICNAFVAIAVATVSAGCAKAPVTTSLAAPAVVTPSAPVTDRFTGAGAGGETPTGNSQRRSTAMQSPVSGVATPGGTARPTPKEFSVVEDLRDIHFAFDRYDIRPEAAEILGMSSRWLKAHPNYAVLIEGHCDERGANEYNLALGERRAKTSMNYLVSLGINAARIAIVSYGEERPVCAEKTERCRTTNRRAHFLVKPM